MCRHIFISTVDIAMSSLYMDEKNEGSFGIIVENKACKWTRNKFRVCNNNNQPWVFGFVCLFVLRFYGPVNS